jgi:DNA-directed RNA polymerase subunit RPC12/RpoP
MSRSSSRPASLCENIMPKYSFILGVDECPYCGDRLEQLVDVMGEEIEIEDGRITQSDGTDLTLNHPNPDLACPGCGHDLLEWIGAVEEE